MAPRKFWITEKDAELRGLWERGKSVEEIARKFRKSLMAIYKRSSFLKLNLPARRYENFRSLAKEGLSAPEIAKRLRCTIGAVYKLSARAGVSLRQSTSKYRGVNWNSQKKKWKATIYTVKTGKVFLGHFKTEEEAAKAWDAFVKKNKIDRPLNF